MLKFQNVTAYRSGTPIVSDFSCEFRSNAFTAIIGKNGCGKSTVVGCLNGQTRYDGKILLGDRDIKMLSARERAKNIAVLPQILPDSALTVFEIIRLGRNPYLSLSGRLSGEDEQKIEQAAVFTGMTPFLHRKLNRLSGGERQRAYLAMVLSQDTRVIVLDEGTTYMDASGESEFFALIKELMQRLQKTVVMVTHNLSRAVNEADEVLMMHMSGASRLISAKELMNTNLIEEEFGVKKRLFSDGEKERAFYE
ncbi:MAG: ABC transporter ATP-binding protein [Clostridia bacterium]|nr:ABC transporter ATP-binding protein [Clostridia bacterium]